GLKKPVGAGPRRSEGCLTLIGFPMSIKNKAYVVGAFEHPTRYAPDKSTVQLHAECAIGALKDAGLELKDVDGYFGARDIPGTNATWLVDYLNLKLTHIDATDTGGCSYLI